MTARSGFSQETYDRLIKAKQAYVELFGVSPQAVIDRGDQVTAYQVSLIDETTYHGPVVSGEGTHLSRAIDALEEELLRLAVTLRGLNE